MLRSTPASDADAKSGPGPEEPPSRPERRPQVDTSFDCPAIELTAIRLEGWPPDAGHAVELLASLGANASTRARSGRIEGRKEPASEGDRFPLTTLARFRSSSIERLGSRKGWCGCRSQDPSTSSRSLAYKDPSLQKLRASVNDPSCGMMAPAATGAVVREYEPLNL